MHSVSTMLKSGWILPVLAHCLLVFLPTIAAAQDIERVEAPLIEQQPFDLITLTEDEGGESVKVFPLPFRQMPTDVKPTDKLETVVLKYSDRRYEVTWRAIERIEFYEQRIYDEALAMMEEKRFAEAFSNLSFLMKNYPSMPRLETLRQQFIFQSAQDRFAKGELRQTLSALEELRATAPGFQATAVTSALSRVADRMIAEYQQGGDLGSAHKLLKRLKNAYGPTLQVVVDWENRLEQMALAKEEEARLFMANKDYRKARQAAVEMIAIFPDMEEGKDLINEINRIHPMVRVGVMQRSGDLNPASLVDWPARRAGALVYQSLFRFLETGAEGGRYGCALGTFRMSDDRQQLILSLDPNVQATLNAFGLAQELLQRADPRNQLYDPSWAAIFRSVSAQSASQVIVNLKRPNVLPHALLQWILPDSEDQPGGLPGDYEFKLSDGNETSFSIRGDRAIGGQPVEIIEIFYSDPKDAVNDLLRGEIDILDQLYPADAKRLATNPKLTIGSYALPTTHMLIPLSDHEYLANSKFRRALLYATNREAMLQGELLNSTNLDDGRLISGPFPIGDGESDTLAYAYNPDIQPTEYSPHLARLLLVMTQKELEDKARKNRDPDPELKPLLIGCPDFEFARVAVQAMIQQWTNVGIKAEMVILPSGKINQEAECDLLYVVTTMWEPATDIERLLGGNGLATTDNPFIVQALEKLRFARNWREIREAMQDLHQLVDYHLPVLPLWQITDRFAVSSYVEGLDDHPVSLYQDIASWRVNLGTSVSTSQ